MSLSNETNQWQDRLLGYLAAHGEGVRAPELCALLGVSQPTLSRALRELKARGLVASEGKARATRYHWVGGRTGLAALRRRRMHEIIAGKLVDRPELLNQARKRLERMTLTNPAGRTYHHRWAELMASPLPRVLRTMTEDSETADQLRKESPFTVLLTPEERRAVFARLGQLQ